MIDYLTQPQNYLILFFINLPFAIFYLWKSCEIAWEVKISLWETFLLFEVYQRVILGLAICVGALFIPFPVYFLALWFQRSIVRDKKIAKEEETQETEEEKHDW
jgi:hypothetical protein